MNPFIDELSQAVLKKSLQDCNIEELQRLIEEYPYFGPGQLLLAKKLSEQQADNSSLYKEQLQKTSLYFNNRVWLDYLLNDSSRTNSVSDETIVIKEETALPDPYPAAERIINVPMEQVVNIEPPETGNAKQPDVTATTSIPAQMETEPAVEANQSQTEENTQAEDPAIKNETSTDDTDLSFQPYHTVDYFASQGIRFREGEQPKDRLSAQLKSFTEWLKTLKRVPTTEMAVSSDPTAEKKVEQMAEYSIAERHVITEAMAEVWKKQGNTAKAEDIYRKLSLLDPSKSSYFAAKIEDLKKTS